MAEDVIIEARNPGLAMLQQEGAFRITVGMRNGKKVGMRSVFDDG